MIFIHPALNLMHQVHITAGCKHSIKVLFPLCMQHPDFDEGEGFLPNDITVVQATSSISGINISPGTIAPKAPVTPTRMRQGLATD